MKLTIEQEFSKVWLRIGAITNPQFIINELKARYNEPGRFYHTWQHILDCYKKYSDLAYVPNRHALFLAILFHDAIHDTQTHGNELESANLAVRTLREAMVSESIISDVSRLIMITRHSALPKSLDEQYMVDIYLSIFGQSTEIFDEYEVNICKEYEWVPEQTYVTERLKILRMFADRPRTYSVDIFENRYGLIAKVNLQRSISMLEKIQL